MFVWVTFYCHFLSFVSVFPFTGSLNVYFHVYVDGPLFTTSSNLNVPSFHWEMGHGN